MVEGVRDMDMAAMQDWAERLGSNAAQMLDAIKETMRDMLEPEEAARRILAAVQDDLLHALPSGDIADGARTRAQMILDALDTQHR